MKFCSKCGQQIEDDAVICIHCGRAVEGQSVSRTTSTDTNNIGMLILGLLIPLAGLIVYLINKDTKPQMAMAAGKGALIGFGVSIVLYLIFGAIAGSLIGSIGSRLF